METEGKKSLCSMVHRLNRWADRCRAGQSGLMVQRWTMVWRSLFDNPCTEIAACPQLICLMSLALCSLINWKNRPFAPLPSLQELATWLSAKEQRIHLGEVQIGGEKKAQTYPYCCSTSLPIMHLSTGSDFSLFIDFMGPDCPYPQGA